MKNVNAFKKIGFAEAISYLLLLGVAMPLKYMFDMPIWVKYVGWIHGVLFIAYVVWLLLAAYEQKWGMGKILLGFIASLLPFGPFIFHRKIIE